MNRRQDIIGLSFNPCFVGNRSGSRVILVILRFIRLVSILVLLEIGLGARFDGSVGASGKSFNPCFVGNRSGRPLRAAAKTVSKCFNPCFVGNRSGRLRCRSIPASAQLVSILVLLEIGLGVAQRFIVLFQWDGFNPCFVGNRSGSEKHLGMPDSTLMFQSLFCWKSVWELQFRLTGL